MKFYLKFVCTMFLFGSTVGTLGDFSHVASGIELYPESAAYIPLLNLPFWVPIIFGFNATLIGIPTLLLLQLNQKKRNGSLFWANSWPKAHLATLTFFVVYVSTSYIPLPPGGIKDLIIMFFALFAWAVFNRTIFGIFLGVLSALGGLAGELLMTSRGDFFYAEAQRNLLTVPSWIPWLYFTASTAVGSIASTFLKNQKTQNSLHS